MTRLLKKLSLKNQFLLVFVSFFLLGSGIIGYYGYQSTKDAYTEDAINKTEDNLKLLQENTRVFLNSIPSDLEFLGEFYAFKQYLNWLSIADNDKLLDAKTIVEDAFRSFLKNKEIFYKLRFIDEKGYELINLEYNQNTQIIKQASSFQNKKSKNYFKETFAMSKGEFYVSNINLNKEFGKVEKPHIPVIRYGMPIFKGEDKVGILVLNVYVNNILNKIKKSNSEFRKYMLIDNKGNYIVHEDDSKTFAQDLGNIDNFYSEFKQLNEKFGKHNGNIIINDTHIISFKKIIPPNKNSNQFWTLVSFADKDFALRKANNFTFIFSFILITTLLLVAFAIYQFMTSITKPLNQVTDQLKNLSKGIVEKEEIIYPYNDEIGYMVQSVQLLKQNTKELINHSRNISKGNYENILALRDDDDTITQSLNDMSKILKLNYEKNIEEHWIQEGINNLTLKLSGEKSVQEITEETLEFLIPYIKAAKGCVFLYDNETEELYISTTYAHTNEKFLTQRYKIGEGIVGQSAKNFKVIIHNGAESNPIIHSSLMNEKANGYITLPLIHENKLLGVIEILSLHPISNTTEKFILEIEDIVATYLYSGVKNEEIKNLLKETQATAQELLVQREELEETNNELVMTQENLKQQRQHLESLFKKVSDSIQYASLIQNALIPSDDLIIEYFEDYFSIWEPKDIVGGDIYLFEKLRDGDECILMVIDCTGHGVPGAFVTMLVKAIEQQVIATLNNNPNMEVSPAWILEFFNKKMKILLKQDKDECFSNVGFDGGIFYYNRKENIIKYAGAHIPLIYIDETKELQMIKGDRDSIGYKNSDLNYQFKEHTIEIKGTMKFYITTDGYIDQNGGEKGYCFGRKRFKDIILNSFEKDFKIQKEIFMEQLLDYQKKEERNDDITFVGFKLSKTLH